MFTQLFLQAVSSGFRPRLFHLTSVLSAGQNDPAVFPSRLFRGCRFTFHDHDASGGGGYVPRYLASRRTQ